MIVTIAVGRKQRRSLQVAGPPAQSCAYCGIGRKRGYCDHHRPTDTRPGPCIHMRAPNKECFTKQADAYHKALHSVMGYKSGAVSHTPLRTMAQPN